MDNSLKREVDLFNLTYDSILVFDLNGRILFWNQGAEKTYGWTEKEVLGKVAHELLQTQFPQPLPDIKNDLLRNGQWDGELIHSTRDGARIVVLSRWALKRDAGARPESIIEINHDITERKRAEQKFHLLLSARRVVAEANDLRSALEAGLRAVCEHTGWDYAEAWIPRSDGGVLEPADAWYYKDKKLEPFRAAAASMTFQFAHGLLGQAWADKHPKWISNLADEPRSIFPLAPAARDNGIKAALAIPVLVNDEVIAVLGFYMLEIRGEDQQSIELVSELAHQIGSALLQKRAAETLRQSHSELEVSVQERTAQLAKSNQALQVEIGQRRRIQEAINARARQQAAVAQIGQLALGGTDPARLLEEACSLVTRTLNIELCKVLELLPDGKALRLCAGVGWKSGLVAHATVPTGFESQAGYTLLSGAPVVVEDFELETRFSGPALLHDHGVVSGMSVVIPGRPRQFGVLGAHTIKRRSFDADDVHFLEAVANVLSEAIERKAAEDEIRRRGAWLQSLIDTTQDAVVSIDRKGRIVLFNPAAERIFGYSKAEVEGRKVTMLMAEPYASEHDEYVGRYERGGEPRAIGRIRTVEARRKDGESFPIELSVTQVATAESEEVHYAAFIRDISELRRRQAWLQGLIQATQDAVISIDRHGCIVLFNPAAERMFGYSAGEIAGRKVNELMGEPYAAEHDDYIARYERGGEARAIGRIRTVTAKRKNGELFPIELSVTEIAADQEVRYAAFIRDISDKVRLQEKLVESERLAAIGTTAAKIGHELGNPLNGMSLTVQLLEQRLNKQATAIDGQVFSTVNRLKNEISRLNTLLEHFRSLSRREKFYFQPASLTSLVGEALEIEIPRYTDQGVEVECTFASDLPSVSVDVDKMKQVILNLAKNAVEAMPGGGKLSIKGSARDHRIVLEVADTGIGIPPGIDVFAPFFSTKAQGTGIGLAIVQQIIRSHEGSITYESAHGKGTTFIISLPRK